MNCNPTHFRLKLFHADLSWHILLVMCDSNEHITTVETLVPVH